jgi:hypothetical protein
MIIIGGGGGGGSSSDGSGSRIGRVIHQCVLLAAYPSCHNSKCARVLAHTHKQTHTQTDTQARTHTTRSYFPLIAL